jgi:hypothetical protein
MLVYATAAVEAVAVAMLLAAMTAEAVGTDSWVFS